MQFAKACSKYVRISPQKVRPVAGLIRQQRVEDALLQLRHSNTKGGKLLLKTLSSAIANAESTLEAKRENLVVHEVRIDGGPIMYRAKSKNRGGKVPIRKRTSHFTIIIRTL